MLPVLPPEEMDKRGKSITWKGEWPATTNSLLTDDARLPGPILGEVGLFLKKQDGRGRAIHV